jgi:general secretion pathway protein I
MLKVEPISREKRTTGCQPRTPWGAFTIVEVVVALTILGVAVMAIFGALRACSQATHHARMLTGSVLLAERLLTEIRLNENRAFETRNGGDGLYQWRVRVAPTPVEGLGAIHVQVTWPEQQRRQQYDLFSLAHMQSFEQRQ